MLVVTNFYLQIVADKSRVDAARAQLAGADAVYRQAIDLDKAGVAAGIDVLRAQVERMLGDAKAQRFVSAFLDYWVDLRKVSNTSPDELLYPDYYLDDLLVESAEAETRAFFAELLRGNLPARNLVASNFVTINERLATLYGLSGVEGVRIRRVPLPPDSVRGGLLTQAGVLKVTANCTELVAVVNSADPIGLMDALIGAGGTTGGTATVIVLAFEAAVRKPSTLSSAACTGVLMAIVPVPVSPLTVTT